MIITDVKGRGKQKGIVYQWRGRKCYVDLNPKIKIEIVVLENRVEDLVDTIVKNAATGEIGDGKILQSLELKRFSHL